MPLKPRPRPLLEEPGHPSTDPWNTMLDEFEAQLRLLLDNDLEPQLRTRLDRLLPSKSGIEANGSDGNLTSQSETSSERGLYRGLELSGDPAACRRAGQPDEPDPMALAGVLVICRQLERFKLTAGQHAAIAKLKEWLMAQMPRERAVA